MEVYDPHNRDYDALDVDVLRTELRKADERVLQVTNQMEITDLFPQIERLQAEVEALKSENVDLRCGGTINETASFADKLSTADLEGELGRIRTQMSEQQERESAALLKASATQRTLDVATQQLDVQTEKVAQLSAELLVAHQELESRASAVRDRDAALHRLEVHAADLQHSLGALETGCERERAQSQEECLGRVESARRELDVASAHLAAATTERDEAQAEVRRLVRQVEAANGPEAEAERAAETERLQKAVRDMRSEVMVLRDRNEDLAERSRLNAQRRLSHDDEWQKVAVELEKASAEVVRERARASAAASRVGDLNEVVADYKAIIEKGNADIERLKEKLGASQAALLKVTQDSESTGKTLRQNKQLREQLQQTAERATAAEEERSKMRRDVLKQAQKLQETTVMLSRSQEKEKAAGSELKRVRAENKQLQDSLKETTESALHKHIDELTTSNAILKEMVRSANINNRVSIARHHKGMRRPSQSTVMNMTRSLEEAAKLVPHAHHPHLHHSGNHLSGDVGTAHTPLQTPSVGDRSAGSSPQFHTGAGHHTPQHATRVDVLRDRGPERGGRVPPPSPPPPQPSQAQPQPQPPAHTEEEVDNDDDGDGLREVPAPVVVEAPSEPAGVGIGLRRSSTSSSGQEEDSDGGGSSGEQEGGGGGGDDNSGGSEEDEALDAASAADSEEAESEAQSGSESDGDAGAGAAGESDGGESEAEDEAAQVAKVAAAAAEAEEEVARQREAAEKEAEPVPQETPHESAAASGCRTDRAVEAPLCVGEEEVPAALAAAAAAAPQAAEPDVEPPAQEGTGGKGEEQDNVEAPARRKRSGTKKGKAAAAVPKPPVSGPQKQTGLKKGAKVVKNVHKAVARAK